MGWNNMDIKNKVNGLETSSKILLGIISCVILIIVLMLLLLSSNSETVSFLTTVDGVAVAVDKENLLKEEENIIYFNIEEFAKLVKYDYHDGEYKAFNIEKDKCYVQGEQETTSFYLNENKIYKLITNDFESEYKEFEIENKIKEINGKKYAPIEAISLAFNVQINQSAESLTIFTLDYLVDWYNKKAIEWGYTGIESQNFENKKLLLYGYLIVKKENGLYKVINNANEEIISDKYNSIEFSENAKEFFVTNSLEKVGLINLDGTVIIDPIYDSISILNKKMDMYIVQIDKKYGLIKSGGVTIIPAEYDMIGLDEKSVLNNVESRYLILNSLIPVCNNNKWGAYDKNGNLIYNIEYDGFGCELTTIDIKGYKEEVKPVLYMEEYEQVVVKQNDKYGIIDLEGKIIIQPVLDIIYAKSVQTNQKEYYTIKNGQEVKVLNVLTSEDNDEGNNAGGENTIIDNSINSMNNTILNNIDIENIENNLSTNESITVTLD